MLINPILATDSYKFAHPWMFPPGTSRTFSYMEARKSKWDETVFFGLQAFLKEHLSKPITLSDINEAEEMVKMHGLPFNRAGYEEIVNRFGGFLPVTISAVPEGTCMAPQNVQMVVETEPGFAWLTWAETALLRAIWYPSTVATLSREMKKFIWRGLMVTSDDPEGQIPFKLHDFGGRGATSQEAACLGGMGHLVNFMGTDTVEALVGAKRFYGEKMAGYSVPAAEHSTITAWGQEREEDAYRHILNAFPTGLVSVVSDSYNIMNAVDVVWGQKLKDQVLDREGVLVIRPDSGDPTTMALEVIECAMDRFGYRVNKKGFKVLNDKVRVIHGDGMNEKTISVLIANAIARGISVDNFVMGMGGGLLQNVNRDTLAYAYKVSAAEVDGKWVDVFKKPQSDVSKKSKAGRLALVKRNSVFQTIREDELVRGSHGSEENHLRPVWKNGELLVDDTFAQIRERASVK